MTGIDLRTADARFRTELSWLRSRHSFSFGSHYDPANTHFGLLVVHNDDVLAPGGGFPDHPHRDMEIVTWVLDGRLAHADSTGQEGEVVPGLLQRMSAGSGVVHSERNASDEHPVHFVQMWVWPDEPGGEPNYAQRQVGDALAGGELVPVTGGRGDALTPLRQRDAVLWVGRLPGGRSVPLPTAPYVHLFVARGAAELEGAGPLSAGDEARLTSADGQRVTATEDVEVLVWEMHRSL